MRLLDWRVVASRWYSPDVTDIAGLDNAAIKWLAEELKHVININCHRQKSVFFSPPANTALCKFIFKGTLIKILFLVSNSGALFKCTSDKYVSKCVCIDFSARLYSPHPFVEFVEHLTRTFQKKSFIPDEIIARSSFTSEVFISTSTWLRGENLARRACNLC